MSAFTVRDGILYRDGVEATDADALEICRELSPAIQKFVPEKETTSAMWAPIILSGVPICIGLSAKTAVNAYNGKFVGAFFAFLVWLAAAYLYEKIRAHKAKRASV